MATECLMDAGAQGEVSMDSVLALSPSGHVQTRLDENFDQMCAMLTSKGATLESAMQTLWRMRETQE